MPPRVTITKDNVSKVFAGITELVGQQVLIGIPEDKNKREGDDTANNAMIGAVHEFGSPLQNIPARPWLIPGVKKAEKPALTQLRKAADAALNGNTEEAARRLAAAGIIGANEARGEINSNIPPPLSPSTIAHRPGQRKTKSMRKSEIKYFELLDSGMSPGDAQSAAGIVALINSGQLRNSITSVVRKK
jgi:hypothetical protein